MKNVIWSELHREYDIAEKVLEELGLQNINLDRKILVLDGFDEISVENNREKILNGLYQGLIKKSQWSGFSLILTCREHYIQNLYNVKCNFITLQPWDEGQIRSFCNIYQEKTKCSISENTISKILEIRNILGIPLILYMVLALEIVIEKDGSIVDVYDKIFSLEDGGIYDRCINNKNFGDSHRISGIKKQIHQISRRIAFWMFENEADKASISQEEYQKICSYTVQNENKKHNIEKDFLISNFFKLVKHCEGIEAEELCFVHRTIYEYFVAETIFVSMKEKINLSKEMLACTLGRLLKTGKLSKNMLYYLKQKIDKSKLKWKFDIIYETFQLMLQDGMTYYTEECYKNVIGCEMNVFANMLDVIHLWENNMLKFDNCIFRFLKYRENRQLNLSFIDWEGEKIENIDLSNVNLSYANFKNATLKNVNLYGANLTNAILYNTSLQGVTLDGVEMYGVKAQIRDFFGAIYEGNILDKKFFEGINVEAKFSKDVH